MEKLRAHKLYAKFSKCEFWQEKVAFLGHILTTEEVAVDPEKVEAVSKWQQPTSVSEIRSFLGLAGYYRRFIEAFSKIARPIDEPMAPQIIAACVDKKKCNNSKNSDGNDVKNLSVIKLGAFCFDVNQNIMKKGFLSSTASIARKVIFGGANNLRKKKEIQSGGIIHIVGSVHVEINQT